MMSERILFKGKQCVDQIDSELYCIGKEGMIVINVIDGFGDTYITLDKQTAKDLSEHIIKQINNLN